MCGSYNADLLLTSQASEYVSTALFCYQALARQRSLLCNFDSAPIIQEGGRAIACQPLELDPTILKGSGGEGSESRSCHVISCQVESSRTRLTTRKHTTTTKALLFSLIEPRTDDADSQPRYITPTYLVLLLVFVIAIAIVVLALGLP